jgi:hypothetical protein
VSITIEFTPWAPFHAYKNQAAIQAWLRGIGEASKQAFIGGMGHYPPASSPGAWPNVRTGGLRGSVDYTVSGDELTVGSNMPYSIFLRAGTSRMARRKMSDNALQEGMKAASRQSVHWVEWRRG